MLNPNTERLVPQLTLASQSRARRQLLLDAGIEVVIRPTGIDEPDLSQFSDLEAGLAHVAELKARAAWRSGVTGWILAADTVTRVDGKLLGKPADRTDAERMLRLLSGSTHDVLTGWRLLDTTTGITTGSVECTKLTMRPWTESEILGYLDGGEWEGRCGAYGLEDPDPFVIRTEGSHSNVVGLPMERIRVAWEQACRADKD